MRFDKWLLLAEILDLIIVYKKQKIMKNSILSILGLLTIISISGQNYFPVVEENKKWNVMYVGFPGFGDTIYSTNTYKFEGDTVINGLNYLKVYKSEEEIPELWTLEGCIREDQDKKVYFNKWGIDYLKYDFGVEIGDTIEISPNYSPLQVLVESIDSVIINGIYRKSILLKDITYSNAHELWIEGVGSNRGILESGTAGYVGGWRWFLCMSQNEELIYMNPNYNNCYLKSQEYIPLVQESSEWNDLVVTMTGPYPWDTLHFTETRIIGGDTTIGSHTYKKLFKSTEEFPANWQYAGGIREEGQKVYSVGTNINFPEREIYDFSVIQGDTIEYYMETIIVDSVAYKPIYGQNRKHIYLSYFNTTELWIEGIGSNRGLLYSGSAGVDGGRYWFLCKTEDGVTVYMNPNYNTCYLKTTSINENIKPIIGVYPNPTTNYLWISIPDEMPLEGLTVEVFNTAGLSMTTTRPASHTFSIETGHLPSGFYFVRINTGEESFTTKFSVKGM
jgi:hypothetical protein